MFNHWQRAGCDRPSFAPGMDDGRSFRRFGRGGPFGRHRGGPFGGRGPRMFDPGALRLVVLGLIAEQPRHGYDIIKGLETRLHGAYAPSPGAIYPMLQMLEEADLVSSEAVGNKRLYTISDTGRAYLDENRAELDKINAQLDAASGDAQTSALGEEMRALRHVLHHKLRGEALTAEQARELTGILATARTAIERL